jgi:hypothetical protein
MDFLPLILVILLAAAAIVFFAMRNKGTKHAGDLRPDTPEAEIVTGGHAVRQPGEGRGE